MVMASKIRVTLTRVYEYDISKIQAKLKKAGYNDDEIDDFLLKYTAKTEALEDFSCEMVYIGIISNSPFFEENIDDFVGTTAEIID